MFDTAGESGTSTSSLKEIHLLLMMIVWELHLQLFLCKVIYSTTGNSIHIDVWKEGAYRLIIHYKTLMI